MDAQESSSSDLRSGADLERTGAARSTPLFGLALALILAIAAALRLWDIDADPPAAVDGDFISDEGWWAHNARNHYLYGRWITDDWNHPAFATPVHTLMLRAAFGVLGLGLGQARVVSAISGLVTLLALVVWLQRSFGRRAALFGAVVFAADFFSYTYHRVAMVEANATAMMTIAIALCAVSRRSAVILAVAGAVGVLAIFTKMNSVFFLPALAVAAAVVGDTGPRAGMWRKSLAWIVVGAASCTALWVVLFLWPNWDEFVRQNQRLATEGRVTGRQLLSQAFGFGLVGGDGNAPLKLGGFLSQSAIPLTLTFAWLWLQAIRIRREGLRRAFARASGAERVALVWIAFQFLYLATNYSTSDRRYVSFVVPLSVLGASLCADLWRDLTERTGQLADSLVARWGTALALACAAALYLRAPIATWLSGYVTRMDVGATPGLSPGTLAALATLVALLPSVPLYDWLLGRAAPRPWSAGRTGALMSLLGLSMASSCYANDLFYRTHTMRDTGQEIQKRWGADARVAGGIAETLLLDSRLPTLTVLDRRFAGYGVYGAAFVNAFAPTHVIETPARDEAELRRMVEPVLPGYAIVPNSVTVFRLCRRADGSPRFFAGAGTLRRTDTGAERRSPR